MVILFISILLFIIYSALIFYYLHGWMQIPVFTFGNQKPSVKISVIVPARNEEENIGKLLQALQRQTYPKELFEVIVINDYSTDNTAKVVEQYAEVKLVDLSAAITNSYKKKAIETGIEISSGELIVTTDADCIPPPEWLHTIAAFRKEKKAKFIAAPVAYSCNSSVLQVFQVMDFLVLQGITGASVQKHFHTMCNGANLAYEREIFYEVNGFAGIDHIASGDDMLLMHKIWKKYPHDIYYLKAKEALMCTQPMTTWKNFFHQRIRWASKATAYNDKWLFPLLLLVYLFNLLFVFLLIAGFFNYIYWIYFGCLWVLKTLAELSFFYTIADFFNKKWTVKYFFIFQPLHIFYTIIAGWLGQFGKYEWKGRRVR